MDRKRGIDLKNMKAPSTEELIQFMERFKEKMRDAPNGLHDKPKPDYKKIVEDVRNGVRPGRVSFSTTEARTGDFVDVSKPGAPAVPTTNTEEPVPGCALSEGDLDTESIAQLVKDGFLSVYDDRIQVVSNPRPIEALIARADSIFRWLEAVLPRRLLNEEVGDAVEAMNRIADGCHRYPRLMIGFRFVVTLFCVAVHCVRFVSAGIWGKKAE